MDPRAARSRAALRDAVFALAAEQRIETVAISEVARRAGITRNTLYNHGRTPAELLEHLLDLELAALRARFSASLTSHSVPDSFDEGIAGVVAHLVAHEAVYEVALADPPSSRIHHLLSTHFSDTLVAFLRTASDQVPVPPGFDRERSLEASIEAASAYAAHGAVGIIEAWFRRPAPRDPAFLAATMTTLIPRWYETRQVAEPPTTSDHPHWSEQ